MVDNRGVVKFTWHQLFQIYILRLTVCIFYVHMRVKNKNSKVRVLLKSGQDVKKGLIITSKSMCR